MKLKSQFSNREDLKNYIKDHFKDILEDASDDRISSFRGNLNAANQRLSAFNVQKYARSRNFYEGEITRLSPYIRHGIISSEQVRQHVLSSHAPKQIEKFLQELVWRYFWQDMYHKHPEYIWTSREAYKTGFEEKNYANQMPDDILQAETPNAAINHFIHDLYQEGYVHNHARMYIASYVIHFRRIKWQVGAAWFLKHLIDGDPASNNLSWQWIASTFSNKPYIFNLENVTKYCGSAVDCRAEENPELDASYADLSQRLFPNLKQRMAK